MNIKKRLLGFFVLAFSAVQCFAQDAESRWVDSVYNSPTSRIMRMWRNTSSNTTSAVCASSVMTWCNRPSRPTDGRRLLKPR